MKDLSVLRRALKIYGWDAQREMFFEEVGEALNALAKFGRGRATELDILEELADVVIMAEQLAIHYGWESYIDYRRYKIERLAERLEKKKSS